MTPTDIVMEMGSSELADAIDHTRYALSKQAPSAGQVSTNYGLLVLTCKEQDELRAYLSKMLERRLKILEARL